MPLENLAYDTKQKQLSCTHDTCASLIKDLRLLTLSINLEKRKIFGDKKMENKNTKQTLKTRLLATLVTCLLILAIALPLTANVQAQTTSIPAATHAFMSATPSPIGVGQKLFVVMWLAEIPPFDKTGTSVDFQGFQVTVTLPDGTNQTLGPFSSDDIGTAYAAFTPATTGTYSFQFSFPGQYINVSSTISGISSSSISVYYSPSLSRSVSVTVQNEPISAYPQTALPMPSDYWSAPIQGASAFWNTISGNWLSVPLFFGSGFDGDLGTFNPYTIAPNTAHIAWTQPLAIAGIVGGNFNDTAYYTGLSYEPKWNGLGIIIDGKLFYNIPVSNNVNGGGAVCVDLATGKQLWWQNITLTCGQTYDYESPNQAGVIPYLWQTGSTYRCYDPFTGNLITSFANASTGRMIMGPHGEMLVYIMSASNIVMWNSTQAFVNNGMQIYSEPGNKNGELRPLAGTYDWRKGIQWNTTIPTVTGQSMVDVSPHVLLSAFANATAATPYVVIYGYSAVNGQPLWNYTISPFFTSRPQYNFSPIQNDVYAYFNQATTQWSGYNALTGQKIWGPTAAYNNSWGFYSQSYMGAGAGNPTVANGVLYSSGYDGVHAYNMTNGDLLWFWSTGSTGFIEPYGQSPFYGAPIVADGKVYAATNEHSPNAALYPNERLYCLDAITGTQIWSIEGFMPAPIVAYNTLVAYNNYDGKLYSFTKGQTETTVTAPTLPSTIGSNVLIQGTVTDQSPGTTAFNTPAAGTPAVCDDSMTAWMQYQYMQQPKPTNATGVTVTLTATDPNGNTIPIGTTTSNSLGNFAYSWPAPAVSGLYTVTATFAGSQAYYSSSGGTSFTIANPTATPTQTENPTSIADTYFLPVSIAIILVIIIIGIVLVALMLRKRP